eukprot:Rmarinus@m.20656
MRPWWNRRVTAWTTCRVQGMVSVLLHTCASATRGGKEKSASLLSANLAPSTALALPLTCASATSNTTATTAATSGRLASAMSNAARASNTACLRCRATGGSMCGSAIVTTAGRDELVTLLFAPNSVPAMACACDQASVCATKGGTQSTPRSHVRSPTAPHVCTDSVLRPTSACATPGGAAQTVRLCTARATPSATMDPALPTNVCVTTVGPGARRTSLAAFPSAATALVMVCVCQGIYANANRVTITRPTPSSPASITSTATTAPTALGMVLASLMVVSVRVVTLVSAARPSLITTIQPRLWQQTAPNSCITLYCSAASPLSASGSGKCTRSASIARGACARSIARVPTATSMHSTSLRLLLP